MIISSFNRLAFLGLVHNAKQLAVVGTACLLLSPVLYANDLEETVVIGTRMEQSIFEVPASVSKITSEDIERSQPNDVAELFEMQPGMDIPRTGSLGSVTSVQLRGGQSNQTLFLLNGLRFNSATLGLSQFNLIDPSSISGVEILRGSRSSLYGANALSGVVAINTWADEGGKKYQLGVTGGTEATRRISAVAKQDFDVVGYAINLSHFETEGIDSLVDDTQKNADLDGSELKNINATLTYRPYDEAQIAVSYFNAQGTNDFDNPYDDENAPYAEQEIELLGLSADLPVSDSYSTNISISRSQDSNDQYVYDLALAPECDDPELIVWPIKCNPTSAYETIKHIFYWQHHLAVTDELDFMAGIDYEKDEVEGFSNTLPTTYDEKENTNKALFVQGSVDMGKWDFVLGSRYDDNENWGDYTSSSIAIGLDVDDHIRIYANASDGFRAPTFNDLYWPRSGNPKLKVEESVSKEAGIKVRSGTAYAHIAAFHRVVDNLIDWSPDEKGNWSPRNINKATLQGVELTLGGDYEVFYWSAHWSALSAKGKLIDSDVSDAPLPDRPKVSWGVELGWQRGAFDWGLRYKQQSERESPFYSIDDYRLVNLYGHYDVSEMIRLSLKINNVFDEDYQLNPAYNQYGRTASLGLTLDF